MKKGFTLIEVSILLVIFIIVAFMVVPLSLDDTIQAENISRWKNVQSDFSNIFYTIKNESQNDTINLKQMLNSILADETSNTIKPYNISFLNNSIHEDKYQFDDYKLTHSNAMISVKYFDKNENGILGILVYDVNGNKKPNTWGKDVFGLNIYNDRFEPFCKEYTVDQQKQDCSRHGSGLCCSNYYLIGGDFEK